MPPSMKTTLCGVLAAAAFVFSAGCATAPVPAPTPETTRYGAENTENFMLLDRVSLAKIACTGLQPRTLADGRLEVVANVKNRDAATIQIQINCVFKDANGFSTGDDTPFQTVTLAENETRAVRFTAANPLAKNYTIRVRPAR